MTQRLATFYSFPAEFFDNGKRSDASYWVERETRIIKPIFTLENDPLPDNDVRSVHTFR